MERRERALGRALARAATVATAAVATAAAVASQAAKMGPETRGGGEATTPYSGWWTGEMVSAIEWLAAKGSVKGSVSAGPVASESAWRGEVANEGT